MPLHVDGNNQATLYLRCLQPSDYCALRAAHETLFPIDYDEGFYDAAVNSGEGTLALAAFYRHGRLEELVGFITARVSPLRDCNATDRALLGLGSPFLDSVQVMYILTLGVLQHAQQRGVGSSLLAAMRERGAKSGCCSAFLHVIDYNAAAIGFYNKHGFQELALLPHFYYIATGRQPEPDRNMYNAYLMALPLRQAATHSFMAPLSCVMVLLSPFRRLAARVVSWVQSPSWWGRLLRTSRTRRTPDAEMGTELVQKPWV